MTIGAGTAAVHCPKRRLARVIVLGLAMAACTASTSADRRNGEFVFTHLAALQGTTLSTSGTRLDSIRVRVIVESDGSSVFSQAIGVSDSAGAFRVEVQRFAGTTATPAFDTLTARVLIEPLSPKYKLAPPQLPRQVLLRFVPKGSDPQPARLDLRLTL